MLLWGTEIEQKLAKEIRSHSHTILLPFLPLKEVMALIKEAALVVTGDSFALQAACALSRPTVSFFGPTDPKRNGPFKITDGVVFHEMKCSRCYKRRCRTMECIEKITPAEIAELCVERLEV
jgi:heptosyltransferase-1